MHQHQQKQQLIQQNQQQIRQQILQQKQPQYNLKTTTQKLPENEGIVDGLIALFPMCRPKDIEYVHRKLPMLIKEWNYYESILNTKNLQNVKDCLFPGEEELVSQSQQTSEKSSRVQSKTHNATNAAQASAFVPVGNQISQKNQQQLNSLYQQQQKLPGVSSLNNMSSNQNSAFAQHQDSLLLNSNHPLKRKREDSLHGDLSDDLEGQKVPQSMIKQQQQFPFLQSDQKNGQTMPSDTSEEFDSKQRNFSTTDSVFGDTNTNHMNMISQFTLSQQQRQQKQSQQLFNEFGKQPLDFDENNASTPNQKKKGPVLHTPLQKHQHSNNKLLSSVGGKSANPKIQQSCIDRQQPQQQFDDDFLIILKEFDKKIELQIDMVSMKIQYEKVFQRSDNYDQYKFMAQIDDYLNALYPDMCFNQDQNFNDQQILNSGQVFGNGKSNSSNLFAINANDLTSSNMQQNSQSNQNLSRSKSKLQSSQLLGYDVASHSNLKAQQQNLRPQFTERQSNFNRFQGQNGFPRNSRSSSRSLSKGKTGGVAFGRSLNDNKENLLIDRTNTSSSRFLNQAKGFDDQKQNQVNGFRSQSKSKIREKQLLGQGYNKQQTYQGNKGFQPLKQSGNDQQANNGRQKDPGNYKPF
eukprot:403345938